MFASLMSILLVEEFHDIAPPVDYSLIPPWLVFVATFVGLSLLGWLAWLLARKRKEDRDITARFRTLQAAYASMQSAI